VTKNPPDVVSGLKHNNRLKFHGKSVTVEVSSGSKCHGGRNLGGRNVKAPKTFWTNFPKNTSC
jgi:hypothetical protein